MIKHYIETKDFEGMQVFRELLEKSNLHLHLLEDKLYKTVLESILATELLNTEVRNALEHTKDMMQEHNLEFILIN